ncbi:YbdK family carboxylate-amine ligase [Pigmentiphaga soli]|uniref:Putative glutamate--cysteine ligase 2 n=1 Tax=Pigmentiphaga soli TaxID=1007095 RepID=A0ABP8GH00_9BURK
METIAFTPSAPHTLGIELELQILDPATHDLKGAADELLAQFVNHPMADRVKPEITQAMIELNSSVHTDPARLLEEMRAMRDALNDAADAVGVRIAGGGTHPFMRWQERAIYDSPRFLYLSEMYGYLARQFTVFGQHIHLGVGSGDGAIALTRKLSPYVPHFIALSASSPYFEGVDTLFSCSRLNALNSFPLCGHMPPEVADWYGFEAYLAQLQHSGLIESIKDLYWDVRPKPEFGTVELRVCDTPLTVEKACRLAAFAQALAVLMEGEAAPPDSAWLGYRTNRFQASRFGLHGNYVDPVCGRMRLVDHLRTVFDRVMPVALELGTAEPIGLLREEALQMGSDARWLRARFNHCREMAAVVESAAAVWRGESPAQVEVETPLPLPLARRRVRASSEPILAAEVFGPLIRRTIRPLH